MASTSTTHSTYKLQDAAYTQEESFIGRIRPGTSLQFREPDEETEIKTAKLILDFISLLQPSCYVTTVT